MTRPVRALLVLALVASGCASEGAPPSASCEPEAGSVAVAFDGDACVLAEVVADTPSRQRGLMHREELGADAGMLFLFPETRGGGFWMKNTLIPLSIAFMSREGDRLEVLAILDMEPCKEDPCPTYDAGVQYDAALEVNVGWFGRAGVREGSVAEIRGSLPDPR
ncbi:MAG TPA: DUF192 domain-containing protein [Actinomycetota bacterium]|nr:DUF192 domain-containing protein [Actinomycetota bacterium]